MVRDSCKDRQFILKGYKYRLQNKTITCELTAVEEELYYKKIDDDRKKKFSEKPKKERGLDKVKVINRSYLESLNISLFSP